MLNRIRPFLLASLALAFVGQHVAAQNADEAISEEDVTAEQTSGASQDASDAEAQAAAIAQKLSNPVASLISVPIQINYDDNYGLNDKGSVWRTNVQPVIPISLNDDWNMISRTIVPVVKQSDVPIPGVSESGIGDIVQSVFFSPKKPTDGGLIWGVGPVINLPTSTKDTLGLGCGPNRVGFKTEWPMDVRCAGESHVVVCKGR